MTRRGLAGVLAALVLTSPLTAVAQESGDRFDGVRDLIHAQMAERRIPSLTIAVAQHGRIVWEEGFGWADRERRTPATPDTVYGIASISKPLTATGLMRLVEAGEVRLDAPVNAYLGETPLIAHVGDVRAATVRRIANHTAGLAQHWQFFPVGGDPAPPTRDTIRRYGAAVRAPGEAYEYSNINYAALETVIEQVSGQGYADYMRDRVFRPLGMTHTAIGPGADLEPFLAAGYGPDGARLPAFATDYPGGAGASSSAHDLIRFAMFHLKAHLADQEPILSDAGLDEMQRRTAEIDAGRSYGIGWRFDTVRGTVEHGGYYPGASAVIRLVPNDDAAVVVLTNISNDDQATAQNAVADAALRVLIPDWRPAPPRQATPSAPPFAGSPALAGRWTGVVRTYVSDMPLILDVPASGDAVRARLGDQAEVPVRNLRYDPARGVLTGEIEGELDTPDARRARANSLRFELKVGEEVLSGRITALYSGALSPRLTHGVSLTRQHDRNQAGS